MYQWIPMDEYRHALRISGASPIRLAQITLLHEDNPETFFHYGHVGEYLIEQDTCIHHSDTYMSGERSLHEVMDSVEQEVMSDLRYLLAKFEHNNQ